MVKGQSGLHIDDAMMELDALSPWPKDDLFVAKAMKVISCSHAGLHSP